MPCGATQDGRIMVEKSDRIWSTGEGNGKPLQYSCLENPIGSVQSFSRLQLFATPWTAAHQAPCLSPIPEVYSNSCPLSQWCHSTISVIPFSSCLQPFRVSGSFPVSQLFRSDGERIGVSASTSVLPMNSGLFPLGWTGWVSRKSKGLSRVFSNTTVQKYHFFNAQLSSQSNSHIHIWPWKKNIVLTRQIAFN